MNRTVSNHENRTRDAALADESSSLCLPGRGLTLTDLLEALDVLRRRLARSTRGCEGAFAGYDVLDLSGWEDGNGDARIRFTARLVSDEDARQTVEYSAGPCVHRDGRCHPLDEGQYVWARGTTVALAPPKARPAQASHPFVIASPHR